jgi:5-methylcytosine-specific restriction endonuclease McrA
MRGDHIVGRYRAGDVARYHTACERDARGRIRRNPAPPRAFVTTHPCPATGAPCLCPGYVVDHIVPLYRGGSDAPENMQWQNVEEARAKDRVV